MIRDFFILATATLIEIFLLKKCCLCNSVEADHGSSALHGMLSCLDNNVLHLNTVITFRFRMIDLCLIPRRRLKSELFASLDHFRYKKYIYNGLG